MNRIALSSLLLLAVAVADTCFGAAAVLLNNYDANTPIYFLPGRIAGEGWYIQIYAGPDAASVVPLVSTGGGNGVFSLGDNPGFFDGGIGNIPGLADNAPATFVAQMWRGDNVPGGWATAGPSGSVRWTQATGNNSPPNLPAPAKLEFPNVLIAPEPATWVLGLIGASVLLFFRRKQQ